MSMPFNYQKVHNIGLRKKLSNFYLDLAEMLPKQEAGVISILQEIRKVQRNFVKEANENLQPIPGCNSEFLTCRIFEHYTTEMVGTLVRWLYRLFPHIDDVPNNQFINDVMSRATSVTSTGWSVIGSLVSPDSPSIFLSNYRKVTNMPRSIDRVDMMLFQILPSSFVLVLDIVFKKGKVNGNLLRDDFLPAIVLNQFIPHNKDLTIQKMELPLSSVAQIRFEYTDQLINELFQIIGGPPRGTFYALSSSNALPRILVSSLSGLPHAKIGLYKWIKDHSLWLQYQGIDLYSYDTFFDGHSFFISERNKKNHFPDKAQLIVLPEKYISAQEHHLSSISRNPTVAKVIYTLNELQPLLTVQYLLNVLEHNLGELRYKSFTGLINRRRDFLSLGGLFHDNERLSLATMLLSRLAIEYKKLPFSKSGWFTDISKFELFQDRKEIENKKLVEVLHKNLSWRIKNIQEYAQFTEETLSRLVNLRNTSALYRLTIVVTIFTILAALESNILLVWAKWILQLLFSAFH